jgi:MFS family permease
MCAACGLTGHLSLPASAAASAPAAASTASAAGVGPARFAALRDRECRTFLGGTMLSMMADNVEHVITYWVLWQRFHSPALAGFAVISHWAPFLLFSFLFGGLADRYDCRRLIQAGQGLFMAVSVGWGVLFLTGTLQVWQACVLLVVHGFAGVLWLPAEQLMLHDFVGPRDLPSAVRLNATARSMGILFGPVVGSALLLGLGPTAGIFANVLIYLPLTLFLARTRFTGHLRDAEAGRPRPERLSAVQAVRVLRDIGGNPVLVSMIALGGLGSFFIGASLQSAMPIFAHDLGTGVGGAAYGVLLFANGAGGVLGGLLLEATDRIRPGVRSAVVSTLLLGLLTAGFAVTGSYLAAVLLLFVGGVANLAAMSIGQTVVQLLAPPEVRGRVIGVYGMSANGLRTGSGFTVGLLGGVIGVHASLGLSSLAVALGAVLIAVYAVRASRSERALSGRRELDPDPVS